MVDIFVPRRGSNLFTILGELGWTVLEVDQLDNLTNNLSHGYAMSSRYHEEYVLIDRARKTIGIYPGRKTCRYGAIRNALLTYALFYVIRHQLWLNGGGSLSVVPAEIADRFIQNLLSIALSDINNPITRWYTKLLIKTGLCRYCGKSFEMGGNNAYVVVLPYVSLEQIEEPLE